MAFERVGNDVPIERIVVMLTGTVEIDGQSIRVRPGLDGYWECEIALGCHSLIISDLSVSKLESFVLACENMLKILHSRATKE